VNQPGAFYSGTGRPGSADSRVPSGACATLFACGAGSTRAVTKLAWAQEVSLAIPQLDHLLFVVPDLAAAIEELEGRLGVRASFGGRHPSWSTHNALFSLGEGAYFEVLAADPERAAPNLPRHFGLDHTDASRLATWAARTTDLEGRIDRARMLGETLGPVLSGSRKRSDGVELSWRMSDPAAPRAGGVIPFFIDWGSSPHPAVDAPRGVTLRRLRAEHPEASRVRELLLKLGVELPVESGPEPALIATLATPRGEVELR
jgi:Glyoxalase-like domain